MLHREITISYHVDNQHIIRFTQIDNFKGSSDKCVGVYDYLS